MIVGLVAFAHMTAPPGVPLLRAFDAGWLNAANSAGARITEAASRLQLTFPLRFSPSLARQNRLFTLASDRVSYAGFRDAGAWMVR